VAVTGSASRHAPQPRHVGHVLAKLGAANRTEAVARARELSLIPLSSLPRPCPDQR